MKKIFRKLLLLSAIILITIIGVIYYLDNRKPVKNYSNNKERLEEIFLESMSTYEFKDINNCLQTDKFKKEILKSLFLGFPSVAEKAINCKDSIHTRLHSLLLYPAKDTCLAVYTIDPENVGWNCGMTKGNVQFLTSVFYRDKNDTIWNILQEDSQQGKIIAFMRTNVNMFSKRQYMNSHIKVDRREMRLRRLNIDFEDVAYGFSIYLTDKNRFIPNHSLEDVIWRKYWFDKK